ncbi:MAG TPA: MarR family transcriptional regulator [Candidatus Cybelea sp.]
MRSADVHSGLTAPRLSVLSVLTFGGDRTITQLADAEQVRAPTMTRLIDGLQRDGFVRRTSDPHDARIARVTATEKGRSTLEAARERRVGAIEKLLRRLSPSQLRTLAQAATIIEQLT